MADDESVLAIFLNENEEQAKVSHVCLVNFVYSLYTQKHESILNQSHQIYQTARALI